MVEKHNETDSCKTIVGTAEYEETIKKSRFVARASRVDSQEDADSFLRTHRHSDATHNCWAYRVLDMYRFSDDGEPGGSAGKPIYSAIEMRHFDRIIVCVTRYFGGIKLGAGGLARAYGRMAAMCLQNAVIHVMQKHAVLKITAAFEMTNTIYRVFETWPETGKPTPEFTDEGVSFLVTIPEKRCADFSQSLVNATGGNVTWKIIKTGYQ